MQRILFLCKRLYMGKDVVRDAYGRLDQFPRQLRQAGFHVDAVSLAYRWGEAFRRHTPEWETFDLAAFIGGAYRRRCLALARDADVIVASSDSLHTVFAHGLSRRTGKKLVIDLYDDYESFGLTQLPGVRERFRKALREAELVTCVSEPLARHVARLRGGLPILVVPSTISAGQFHPLDRGAARTHLGLPEDGMLVGLSGGLAPRRGASIVIDAVHALRGQGVPVRLALAGRAPAKLLRRAGTTLCWNNILPHASMNAFYNAMNVNVVHVTDDDFGRFSFPQKLYEIAATQTPLVASRIGSTRIVFEQYPELLYNPRDAAALAGALKHQLHAPHSAPVAVPTWQDVLAPVCRWLEN